MRGITLDRSNSLSEATHIRQWLAHPGVQAPDFDAAVYKSMVDMLLWELAQIGGPEHNLERFSALIQALSTFLAGVTIAENDDFVKTSSLSVGVEVYNLMMSFRDAAARDGNAVGSHDG